MTSSGTVYQLIKSNFLERVRSYQYLIVLLGSIVFTYFIIPASDSAYVIFYVGDTTGVINSAFIGTAGSICIALLFSLLGFFLVKNSIQKDLDCKTGEIIAATSMKKWQYTFGKALSNFLIFLSMLCVVFLSMIILQIIRAEDTHIDLWALFSPFLFIVFPLLLLVSALAILFEAIPQLSGTLGNIVHIILWGSMLPMLFAGNNFYEPTGMSILIRHILLSAQQEFPHVDLSNWDIGGSRNLMTGGTFSLSRIPWTLEMILPRLMWVGISVIIIALAAVFFNRFNTEKLQLKKSKSLRKNKNDISNSAIEPDDLEMKSGPETLRDIKLTPLESSPRTPRFLSLLYLDLKRQLKSLPLLWYLGFLGISIWSLVSPYAKTQRLLLPILWALPVFIWPKQSTAIKQNHMEELMYPLPRSTLSQFVSLLSTGWIIALITGIIPLLKMILHGDWAYAGVWLVGSFFIPSFAHFFTTWTGTSKIFEFLYGFLWYIGPFAGIQVLDFMGSLTSTASSNVWIIYACLSGVFSVGTYFGIRYQRLKNH